MDNRRAPPRYPTPCGEHAGIMPDPLMESERLSVIISANCEVQNLERCVRALGQQRSAPDQLVILHPGSLDGWDALGDTPDYRLVRVDPGRGSGAARNLGAYLAEGEILAFIDGDAVVRPGWAEALRGAFAGGASLAGGRIDFADAPTLSSRYASRWLGHDEHGRNGFLPFVSATHLAIRRDVFLRLGGFEESAGLTEDVDLSLRAQLAGYRIVFVPAAELVQRPSASLGGLLKQGLRRGRADRMTEHRFRKFPFMSLDNGPGGGRAFGSAAAALLLAGLQGDVRHLGLPLLHAGVALAMRLGALATDLEVTAGLTAMPGAIAYRDPEQHNTSSSLPGAPDFLLLGDDRLVMTLLRLACEGSGEVILAPPGLEREASGLWDQPAPWSLRLVRMAVRAGWPLAVETAAMRVEREQPRTWGQAFLTLHRVHAWAHGRLRFGLAALGREGYDLARRLPDVPIVIAGQSDFGEDRAVMRVSRRRLLNDRSAVGAELSRLIAAGDPGDREDTRGR